MNARIICLVMGLVMAAGVARGQPEVEWEWTYGGRGPHVCSSVIEVTGGGFAAAGLVSTSRYPTRNRGAFIVRLNENGDSLWTRIYLLGMALGCNGIVELNDGGFMVTGSLWGEGGQESGDGGFFALRLNIDGDSIWSRTFDYGIYHHAQWTLKKRSGGVAYGGAVSLGANYGTNFWINTITPFGAAGLARGFGGGLSDWSKSALEMDDGGYFVAGTTYSFGSGNSDFWLLRIDVNGDSVWAHAYGTEAYDHCEGMGRLRDGGFLLSGRTGVMIDGSRRYHYLAVCTDSSGEEQWSRTYRARDHSECWAMAQAQDGGFVLAGEADTSWHGPTDAFLLRINQDGDSLWSVMIDSGYPDYARSIVSTEDGGYLIGGNRLLDLNNNMPDDLFWVAKLSPDPVSVREPHSTLNPLTFNLFPAYPNPFNGAVTIPFGLDKSAPTRLAIFDPLGRRVADLMPDGYGDPSSLVGLHSVVWDANGMPAGQYIIRLEAGNQQLSQRLSLVK